MIEDIADELSTSLERTVYYGFIPDEADGSLDSLVAIRDFALGRPSHDFGEDLPIITPFGIAVHARAKTQDTARALCDEAYAELLSMGFIALSPPVSLGKQGGRFEVVAQVEAHEIS